MTGSRDTRLRADRVVDGAPARHRVSEQPRRSALLRRSPWLTLAVGALAVAGLWWLVVPDPALRAAGGAALAGATAAAVAARSVVRMIVRLRAGAFGVDLLAVLAIGATLAVGEYLAALIVAVMLTGGEALESGAEARARRALDALLNGAPRLAHRVSGDGGCEQVRAEEIAVGDVVLVRPGELVPVDATLLGPAAAFDESSLTGESLPVEHVPGDPLLSGSVNGTVAVTATATATAAASQYQVIVALVAEAQRAQAPVVRLADRFALPFTVVSVAIATTAWAVSGEAVRFAEVLVLATPCPLLIAAPVAYIGGLGRAARRGVIVKGGAVLETLSRARTVVFDKTGTLSAGRPSVERVEPQPGVDADELLAVAAAAEQYSTHAYAQSILERAHASRLPVPGATGASESGTDGVGALVDGSPVFVGKPAIAARTSTGYRPATLRGGESSIAVTRDGRFAGSIVVTDPVRTEAAGTIARLRGAGVERILLLSGDDERTVARVAAELAVDEFRSGCRPAEKVAALHAVRERPVIMVGDGVNDAPALAAADVGVAMGARGSTAAGEAADVVVLLDDLSRVADAIEIGRRTTRIALQSIAVGIGLSTVLMLIATTGVVPAVAGALLQEAVDVATILGALRAASAPLSRPSILRARRTAS